MCDFQREGWIDGKGTKYALECAAHLRMIQERSSIILQIVGRNGAQAVVSPTRLGRFAPLEGKGGLCGAMQNFGTPGLISMWSVGP